MASEVRNGGLVYWTVKRITPGEVEEAYQFVEEIETNPISAEASLRAIGNIAFVGGQIALVGRVNIMDNRNLQELVFCANNRVRAIFKKANLPAYTITVEKGAICGLQLEKSPIELIYGPETKTELPRYLIEDITIYPRKPESPPPSPSKATAAERPISPGGPQPRTIRLNQEEGVPSGQGSQPQSPSRVNEVRQLPAQTTSGSRVLSPSLTARKLHQEPSRLPSLQDPNPVEPSPADSQLHVTRLSRKEEASSEQGKPPQLPLRIDAVTQLLAQTNPGPRVLSPSLTAGTLPQEASPPPQNPNAVEPELPNPPGLKIVSGPPQKKPSKQQRRPPNVVAQRQPPTPTTPHSSGRPHSAAATLQESSTPLSSRSPSLQKQKQQPHSAGMNGSLPKQRQQPHSAGINGSLPKQRQQPHSAGVKSSQKSLLPKQNREPSNNGVRKIWHVGRPKRDTAAASKPVATRPPRTPRSAGATLGRETDSSKRKQTGKFTPKKEFKRWK